MKLATRLWGALIVGALLVGAYAVYELPRRNTNTSATMPKAKRKAGKDDGRKYAVIQACSRPQQGISMALNYSIGPLDAVDAVKDVMCSIPYTRSGLVRTGDTVTISWAINPAPSLRGFKYRFTVNNQVVEEGEAPTATGRISYRVTGFEAG